jgi:hypothetical protein
MDAVLDVNSAVQHGYELSRRGSHTLQSRDFEDAPDLRAMLIDATVQAIADGSGPRLVRSRLSP